MSTISDTQHVSRVLDPGVGEITLVWDPIDVDLLPDGTWEGHGANILSAVMTDGPGLPWPRRLTHLSVSEGSIQLDLTRLDAIKRGCCVGHAPEGHAEMRMRRAIAEGVSAITAGALMPFFKIKITGATAGARLTGRFCHEVW